MNSLSPEPTPRRWFALFIIIVILLATLPYVYAALRAPEGMFFTGAHSLSPGDLPVYFSYIEQAAQGQTMFRDLFTPEPHSPFIFSPVWLGVGLLRKLTGLSSLVVFHVARVLLIPVFFIVFERWLRAFLPAWRARRLGLLLGTFGAGVGVYVAPWLLRIFGGGETFWPMDLWVTEGYTFLTLYQTPHFIAATTLLLLVMHWFSQGLIEHRTRWFILSGLALLLLTSFHPFHLPMVAAVFILQVGVIAWLKRGILWWAIRGGLIVAGLAFPMILYQGLLLLTNPIVAGRAAQNINHTPAWWIVLLSYGAFLPLAVLGLRRMLRPSPTEVPPEAGRRPARNLRWSLLAAWLVGQFVVFMAPSPFNRRMTEAWLLPLAVFAAAGLLSLWDRRPKRFLSVPLAVTAGFLLFAVSPLVVIGQDLAYWSRSEFRRYPYHFFLDRSYQSAAGWLKANTPEDAVVLSGPIGSFYVPALAGRQVVVAQTVETIEYEAKREAFRDAFLEHPSPTAARAFLDRWGVDYVLWGGEDTRPYPLDPSTPKGLFPVFRSGTLTLFEVRPAAASTCRAQGFQGSFYIGNEE